MKTVVRLALVVTVLVWAGNASSATESSGKQQPIATPPGPGAVGPTSAGEAQATITGTVLEMIDAAGYTYIRLKTPKGEIWAAVKKAAVKKGSEVTVVNAIPMDGFESKALKRKFDHIVFGSLGAGTSAAMGGSPLGSGHATPADKQGQAVVAAQHAAAANAPVDVGEIKVKKAEGAKGKTIAEIFSARASLKDAPVAVRGKVVKYNPAIMGKNWIHLRDGSGSRQNKDDDITVTTLDTAAVGDIVLVQGKVHLDRDFGAGYVYSVIIEDAKVSK
jgi:hypothetical protein